MLIFNGYAIEQQVMKGFIADDQIRLYAWAYAITSSSTETGRWGLMVCSCSSITGARNTSEMRHAAGYRHPVRYPARARPSPVQQTITGIAVLNRLHLGKVRISRSFLPKLTR
jgi:hypothetical protein